DMCMGKAKVSWEVVCLPKKECGLGLWRLDIFNKALMDVPIRGNMTWGWRKILQLRPIIRQIIWYRIGDGSKDLFNDGHWTWPQDWISKYPVLATIMVPNIVHSVVDKLEWRDYSRTAMDFSVSSMWDCILPRGDEITWCDVVWNHMKIYAGTPRVAASLNAIVDYIISISKKKTARSVIAKLVFAASTYFIWKERNYRLFKNQKRSPNQIIDCIKAMVRLKLLTCSCMPFWLLEVSSLSMAVYGSRLEYQLRAVLFFPSPGFFPLGLVVPVFTLRDDPIACLNKAVAFMSVIAASRFLLTNNQLRTFYNPRNQTTIQDGRVTVQQVKRREGQSYGGTGNKGNVTSSGETMHESRQGLLNAIIIKVKDTWLGSALSLKGQEIQHCFRKSCC
ncbi:hypothetical protein Tco_0855360, partial [Tanacetum coccineum]